MKKITLIASLLVVFTACQKADIRPRTEGSEATTPEAKRLSPTIRTPKPAGSGDVNCLGGNAGGTSSNPTVDPKNPTGDPNSGDITDPLRKKDQRDNK